MSNADSEIETLNIPAHVRRTVDMRDCYFCRLCGKYLGERRAIHHIWFGGDRQGMGGRRHHDPDGLISLCWLPGDHNCHQRAHNDKGFWQPLLQEVIDSKTNTTALALSRQHRRPR